jgi:signal transduction histidine kinase
MPSGRGDGRRLTQVLINLVGNAIKFTDVGEVAIKAEANNGAFYVSVRDTGPGISTADQAKLFQEFQQADNAITRKKGGTGLGLAISKRIIEMHGGRIWVESQVDKARPLLSLCRFALSSRRRKHQQALTCCRGPGGQSPDYSRYALLYRLRNQRGRERRTGACQYRKSASRFDRDGYPTADYGRLCRHDSD